MARTKITVCDENRPTAEFDRFEFRNGRLIVGCKCTRNDGMQHECERLKCMADRLQCLTYPTPTCLPSRPCPPPFILERQDNGHHDGGGRDDSPSSDHAAVGGGGSVGSDTGGQRSAERTARYRSFNPRRMRQWAVDQYDDRPALRKRFQPCRVHCVKVDTPRHQRKDAKAKVT